MTSTVRFDKWQTTEGADVLRFNSGTLEVWDGSAWKDARGNPTIAVDYLVIGGGGGGGFTSNQSYSTASGGGGAGGYRCSVTGENTGEGLPAEPTLYIPAGEYSIIVGAGGGSSSPGNDSVFGPIVAGRGGQGTSGTGGMGASSGGGGFGTGTGTGSYPPDGFKRQGFRGGRGGSSSHPYGGTGAGGGGSASVGAEWNGGKYGGSGIESSIDGTPTYRAGGGGGGPSGAGGLGGGGNGAGTNGSPGGSGSANTGSGGGGTKADRQTNKYGGSGGSGVVIFRVPTGTSVSFSAGVSQTSATIGENDVYTVTATSTLSETVTIGL